MAAEKVFLGIFDSRNPEIDVVPFLPGIGAVIGAQDVAANTSTSPELSLSSLNTRHLYKSDALCLRDYARRMFS